MNPHTHILMRLQNIHRRAEHSLRREHIDAAVRDNLESIKREARLALAASEELLGISAGGASATAEPTSVLQRAAQIQATH
jgi:hypothetical protein